MHDRYASEWKLQKPGADGCQSVKAFGRHGGVLHLKLKRLGLFVGAVVDENAWQKEKDPAAPEEGVTANALNSKMYKLVMPDGSIIYLDQRTYVCVIRIQARIRGHLQRQVDRTTGFVRIAFKLEMDFALCDQMGGKLTDPRWKMKMVIAGDVSKSLNLPLHCTQVMKVGPLRCAFICLVCCCCCCTCSSAQLCHHRSIQRLSAH
jgi:hypothetical protein